MKKTAIIIFSFVLISLLSACDLFPSGDPLATSVAGTVESMAAMETSVAATVAAMGVQPAEPTVQPGEQAPAPNAQCGRVSLFLSPALASGIICENLPENINPDGMLFDTYPAHDELTLTGYITGEKFHAPRIIIYPIARFSEIAPDNINTRVASMQALLAGGPIGNGIPLLPLFNAAQVFHAKVQRIDTPALSGFRFITTYSQWAVPINNNELFYTFQGITSDGQYWVSVILPLTNAFLPETDEVPGGDHSTWSEGYEDYLAALIPQLDALADDSFNPSLILLDELVQSMTIVP